MRISGFGIQIDLPDSWDAHLWKWPEADADVPGSSMLVLHAGNYTLTYPDADFGDASLRSIRPGNVFFALKEYMPAAVGTPLFDNPLTIPVQAKELRPENGRFRLPGCGGVQRFFTTSNRAFCLYVVASMPPLAGVLRDANAALQTLVVQDPASTGASPSPGASPSQQPTHVTH